MSNPIKVPRADPDLAFPDADEESVYRQVGVDAVEEDDDVYGYSRRMSSASHSQIDEKLLLEMNAKLQALKLPNDRGRVPSMPSSPETTRRLSGGFFDKSDHDDHSVVGDDGPVPELKGSFAHQSVAGIFGGTRHSAEEDPDVVSELAGMYAKVQECLDLRHMYMAKSLQRDEDNPTNSPDWNIYPPPPRPSWKSETKEFDENGNALHPGAQAVKEAGAAGIGMDFHYDDYEIPSYDKPPFEFGVNNEFVYQLYESESDKACGKLLFAPPTIRDYYMALDRITAISSDGPVKSFSFRRLEYLEAKWNLYQLLNEYQETAESKRVPHRDFYNVRKVDTHVHHSACMNQKHLLRFIKSKMKRSPNEVVIFRDNKLLTLAEVFDSLGLKAYDLSIDTLDMHAHKDTFHRFDKFNLKYNPIGESRLREIFLKTDNYIKGRYLAELTREVFYDLEQSKYQMMEYRISIYGRSIEEWDKLAAWVVDNRLFSSNVRWLIQVPRLFDIYKKGGQADSFADIVRNLFQPLFEVTRDPTSHPKLHIFLHRVVGFDSVDDESKADRRLFRKFPPAQEWNSTQNPPYSYWLYYLYANIASLNQARKRLGQNTFVLRPHCGEAGDPEHLIAAFLTSHSISHGILLRKVPFIQLLYFLDQIGIAMSPLSNNALFLNYDKNPFYSYFKRGLNVSLSSDDPLQFSYTREPLIEEYSVAAQIFKLSNVDMCELARNSVLQSGFEYPLKKHWLGPDFAHRGPKGNVVEKSNVPNIRLAYREETFLHEVHLMEHYTKQRASVRPYR